MAKLLDRILVVDVEATCWRGPNPPGMETDIIEIGIAILNVKKGTITDNRSILVIPERSEISDFCTELTSITPELIAREGISFREACEILKKDYNSQNRAWASYGAYDQKHFHKQCGALKVPYPYGPSHINVKTLFALKHKIGHETGMIGALDILGLELDGTHHRGVDDARNTAKILWNLIS